MNRGEIGVLGVFSDMRRALRAASDLRRENFTQVELRSPVPIHELPEALGSRTSPVRIWTLLGGLAGCASGLALTIGIALDRPMRTGGKPIVSIPPFLVIAFELTILFGALATVAGFLVHSRLPRIATRTVDDPRLTEDAFGVHLVCSADRAAAAAESLRASGAEQVHVAKP